MLESLVVLITPVIYARSVGVAGEWPLLVVTLVYMTFLYPIRILFIWTVRGYYRELRYILHNREIENADTEEQKGKPKFCDNCHNHGDHDVKDLEVGLKPKDD